MKYIYQFPSKDLEERLHVGETICIGLIVGKVKAYRNEMVLITSHRPPEYVKGFAQFFVGEEKRA